MYNDWIQPKVWSIWIGSKIRDVPPKMGPPMGPGISEGHWNLKGTWMKKPMGILDVLFSDRTSSNSLSAW